MNLYFFFKSERIVFALNAGLKEYDTAADTDPVVIGISSILISSSSSSDELLDFSTGLDLTLGNLAIVAIIELLPIVI